MSLPSLTSLYQYKGTPFGPYYPKTVLTFYAPVDNVHAVVKDLLNSTTKSLVVAMYSFTDNEIADIIMAKLQDPKCFVQLTLDSYQATSAPEATLLTTHPFPASSIAIGKSEKGADMHLKEFIVDGLDVGTGSTNWSHSGETLQDNQLTVIRNAYVAMEARARIDAIHANMLAAK